MNIASEERLLQAHLRHGCGLDELRDGSSQHGCYLNLPHLDLRAEDVPALLSLCEALPGIRQLGLSNNERFGPEGAILLAIGLQRCKEVAQRLEGIYLSDDHIGDEGVQALANILLLMPRLRRLGLNSNCVTDKGALALAAALSDQQLSSTCTDRMGLDTLGLARNQIGVAGAVAVLRVAGSSKFGVPLTDIFLSDNPGGDGVAEAAAQLLGRSGGSRLSDQEGGASLREDEPPATGISSGSCKRLGLAGQGITAAGAQMLLTAILENKQVERVCIYNNPIGEVMFKALAALPAVNVKPNAGNGYGTSSSSRSSCEVPEADDRQKQGDGWWWTAGDRVHQSHVEGKAASYYSASSRPSMRRGASESEAGRDSSRAPGPPRTSATQIQGEPPNYYLFSSAAMPDPQDPLAALPPFSQDGGSEEEFQQYWDWHLKIRHLPDGWVERVAHPQ
ncbi:unnamed protein product, partial [Polarella glacialis]